MDDPVQELKIRAEILHRRARATDLAALQRLRALPELSRADEETLRAAASRMRRAHFLAVVAKEHGFSSWEHASNVLGGMATEVDYGTMLYGDESKGTLNVWFAQYEPARVLLDEARGREHRRYLLAWRRHFFITEFGFIESLGLDPEDSDWPAIDYDWVHPRDPAARRRLYKKRLDAMRPA
jgi:hypothetical protein